MSNHIRRSLKIWQRDMLTNEHYLPIGGDYSMKVFRTAGGDYAITCHDDEVGHGGQIEFADDLRKAKREAEKLAHGGEWKRLAP